MVALPLLGVAWPARQAHTEHPCSHASTAVLLLLMASGMQPCWPEPALSTGPLTMAALLLLTGRSLLLAKTR